MPGKAQITDEWYEWYEGGGADLAAMASSISASFLFPVSAGAHPDEIPEARSTVHEILESRDFLPTMTPPQSSDHRSHQL